MFIYVWNEDILTITEEGSGLIWQAKQFLLYSEGAVDLLKDFKPEESWICILETSKWHLCGEWMGGE